MQFKLEPIIADTTYIFQMDIKSDKAFKFTVIERNPNGNRNSLITVPANDWNTYTVTHTTTTGSTYINFFVNPIEANATIYVDNINVNIQ